MGYFVEEVLNIEPSKRISATHYAICNGGKIRYLIVLNSTCARKRLSKNISAYSNKLNILMKMLCVLPYSVLSRAKLGMYVQVSVAKQVKNIINELGYSSWNVIIGSYVEKQKVVFQCFSDEKVSEPAIYIKVGGVAAEQEMKTETEYLNNPIQSNFFYSPKVLKSQARDEGYPFNIQVTEAFFGSKMPPELNQDIYQIFKDIVNSKPPVIDDGIEKVFSHGDFTPWNIKKDGRQYVVFDWEYSGFRFYGFDIIHYLWQIENKLNKYSEDDAFVRAYQKAAKMDSQIAKISQKDLKNQYFCELEKHFGAVH